MKQASPSRFLARANWLVHLLKVSQRLSSSAARSCFNTSSQWSAVVAKVEWSAYMLFTPTIPVQILLPAKSFLVDCTTNKAKIDEKGAGVDQFKNTNSDRYHYKHLYHFLYSKKDYLNHS